MEDRQEIDQEVYKFPEYFQNLYYEFDEDQISYFRDGFTKINLNCVGVFMECFHEGYSMISDIMENFLVVSNKEKPKELRKIIYYQSMFKRSYEYVIGAMASDEKDILYQQEDSEEWKEFMEHYYKYDPFPDNRKVVKSY